MKRKQKKKVNENTEVIKARAALKLAKVNLEIAKEKAKLEVMGVQ